MILPIARWRGICSKVCLVALTLSLVSACGFKLRGLDSVQLAQQRVAIVSESPFGELEKNLQRQIKLAEGVVVSAAQPFDWQVRLGNLDIQQQGVGRDALGRAKQIVLHATLAYQILSQQATAKNSALVNDVTRLDAHGRDVQPQEIKTLRVTRSFYQDYQFPAAQQQQLEQAQREIALEMSRLLIAQLNRIAS